MVNIKTVRIIKGVFETRNLAQNVERFAKIGGQKIARGAVNRGRVNRDRLLRGFYRSFTPMSGHGHRLVAPSCSGEAAHSPRPADDGRAPHSGSPAPRSLHIFFARMSEISVCLGIAERFPKAWFSHQE